jgi:hypothetical protein
MAFSAQEAERGSRLWPCARAQGAAAPAEGDILCGDSFFESRREAAPTQTVGAFGLFPCGSVKSVVNYSALFGAIGRISDAFGLT